MAVSTGTDWSSRAKRLAIRSGLLGRPALLCDLGWFGFLDGALLPPSIRRRVPLVRVPAERRGVEGPDIDWDESHGGIRLADLATYELCIAEDCAVPELLERSDLPRIAAPVFAEARALLDQTNRLFDRFRPGAAVYPQGYILPAAVFRAVARQRGVRSVAIENTFRRDRFCWDDESGISLNSPLAWAFFERRAREGPAFDSGYVEAYRAAAGQLKSAEHTNRPRGGLPEATGRRILFIGQVNTDSSVLFGLAGGFRDQMAATGAACRAVAEGEDTLLVKVHPKEVHGIDPLGGRYDLSRYERLRASPEVAGAGGRIVVDDAAAVDIFDAISWADLCVTVNSQAGLEAAAMGKPVILCGNAAYDRLRSVAKAANAGALARALAAPPEPDAEEARAFFESFCEDYCRPAELGALIELLV